MKQIIAACALGLAVVSSAAADEVGRWYLAPQAGAVVTDDDRNLRDDDDMLFGLGAGKHMNESWSLELNANGARTQDGTAYAASLDALRVFRRNQRWSPYLSVGVGGIRHELDTGEDRTDAMAQAGAGLLWRVAEHAHGSVTLRPEIKARWDDAGRDDFVDYIATLGLQVSFGSPPVSANAAGGGL